MTPSDDPDGTEPRRRRGKPGSPWPKRKSDPNYDTPASERHGTRGCYVWGRCRCEACRQANSDYIKRYRDSRG